MKSPHMYVVKLIIILLAIACTCFIILCTFLYYTSFIRIYIRYRPEVTSHSLAYFCRVASSTRWCLESTYFSIVLTWRNCNGYTRVVLAIVQAKTTFVGDLHRYISSLFNTRGTRDLTNGCNSLIKPATSILEDSLCSHVM